jgi:hypothetical protein
MRALLAALAFTAALPIAACNQPSTRSAYDLPDLPATLPLALGEPSAVRYASAVAELPATGPIESVRVADPGRYYAYADNAWGFENVLDNAPPDYGFYYDDVEPWAWQGYDDSLIFVEPLEYGYRTYYYRPGFDEPYFIRDPEWGYGFDGGRLAVVYGPDWNVVPYEYYGPRLGYASRYFHRGRDLYRASRTRHPVIAYDWVSRRNSIFQDRRGWIARGERQQAWQDYRRREAERMDRHWKPERARRNADEVRFAAWQDSNFRTPAPPRAIPADWKRAAWAKDERRFAPPDRGFAGNATDRARAANRERVRIAQIDRRDAATQRLAAQDRGNAGRQAAERRDARSDRDSGRAFADNAPPAALLRQEQVRRDRQDRTARQTERREIRQDAERAGAGVQRQRGQARQEARQRSEQLRPQRVEAEQRRQVQSEARRRRVQSQARVQERQSQQAERQQARSQAISRQHERQQRPQVQAAQRQSAIRQVERREERAQVQQQRAQQSQMRVERQAQRPQVEARPQERQQARSAARQARQEARNDRRDRQP